MKCSCGSLQRGPPFAARRETAAPETACQVGVEPSELSRSGQRHATIALMLATAMQAFDATIANVALPQLEHSLGGGIDLGSCVMTSYLCASAVTAMMTGW